MGPVTGQTGQSGRSRFRLAGLGLLCSIVVVLLSACDNPQSPPPPIDITASAFTATSSPEPTPTGTPSPTAEPTATFIPTPAPANTPTSTPTVTPLALSAKEVLESATAAVKDIDSGHFEGEFTYEGEIEETKRVLSISTSGVFLTPESAHWSMTYDFESPFIVDIGGDEVDIARENWTQEWFTVGDYVYWLDSLGGNARHRRDDIVLSFEPSDLFELDLLDIDGEISAYEQQLDGERVYHVTGSAAPDRSYPLLGRPHGIDGVVGYWIGAEDHLLRRLEVSVVSVDPTSNAETERLNGFIVLSDYGESVDIRPPVWEGVDDYGNSPASATEISAGESVKASVDSWLDYDFFRFQAEEGRLYHIVVSDEQGYYKADGTHSTLFGPDGVTPESTASQSSGQLGTRTVWQAPASDTYYLMVESGQQETYVYTLTVTLLPEEDDYGDDQSTAHEIGVDETVEGLIGQLNDRDYFKITANQGQVFRVDASPYLQGHTLDAVLHGPDGPLQEARGISSRDFDTWQILWVAPTQGDYHISVEFLNTNQVGSYTLRVVAVTDIADDHSDGAANATALSIGETVGGAIDYEFDLDYFKFNAEEGRGYRVHLDHRILVSPYMTLYASDGFTPEPLEKYIQRSSDAYRLVWMAPEGGTYYLEVKSVRG